MWVNTIEGLDALTPMQQASLVELVEDVDFGDDDHEFLFFDGDAAVQGYNLITEGLTREAILLWARTPNYYYGA